MPSCARPTTNTCTTISTVLERLRHLGQARQRRHRRADGIAARRCCWAASPSNRGPAPRAGRARPTTVSTLCRAVRRRGRRASAISSCSFLISGLGGWPRRRGRRHPERVEDRRGDRGRPGLRSAEGPHRGAGALSNRGRVASPVSRSPKVSLRARLPPRWSGAASAPSCSRRA